MRTEDHTSLKIVVPESPSGSLWRRYQRPVDVLIAETPGDVLPVLRQVEDAVARGRHAAGFMCYEAARGLDPVLATHELHSLPLVLFGVFDACETFAMPETCLETFTLGQWDPAVNADAYEDAVGRIRRYLRSGDTYQVNYTFRLRAAFKGDPWALFLKLHRTQRARYCAFVESDGFALCSASPELFFFLDGDRLEARPMKGTAKRGLSSDQDDVQMRWLRDSEKNRAENVMIVDMIRNDMGRVAEPGSVKPLSMFDLERYPTVLQMTSTVEARTQAPFREIVSALFPCASITGAPKVRTMQIIRELEHGPRGIYTGAIGYLSPGRRSLFNVAIRTVAIDKHDGTAEYGVGGGIVWDSVADDEYEECRTKAGVLTQEPPEFQLLETLLWEADSGYFLLDRHLERLRRSAAYFGFVLDLTDPSKALTVAADTFEGQRYRVRLLVRRDGVVTVEHSPIEPADQGCRRIRLAAEPVNQGDLFLYHKTTNRAVYEKARKECGDCDDVLLWNQRGEVTESTIANVVVDLDGKRVTPPVGCGLLPGVLRQELLWTGEIEEALVTLDDLRRANGVFLINSVRKWVRVELVDA